MSRIMRAPHAIAQHGSADETDNVSGRDERIKLEVVRRLCRRHDRHHAQFDRTCACNSLSRSRDAVHIQQVPFLVLAVTR
ncbi:hypothetical protein [Bradyrhizobium ivorense]|uniref:hypothetical protein n=1 Tax=Bradyrhizobium ivorense TaxID=2511166 RepID=UPI00111741F2|nr:hypothetical protein [Bradyrhizobium ivorense]